MEVEVEVEKGGGGEATGGFHSAEERKRGQRGGGKKKHTITDEKMRCEEGKMLLLEAFFSNQ